MRETTATTLLRRVGVACSIGLLALGVVLVEGAFRAPSSRQAAQPVVPSQSQNEFVFAGWKVETGKAMKNIEDIQPGDVVMAFDDRSGEQRPKRVVQVFRNLVDHVYVITVRAAGSNSEQTLRATAEHPFLVPGEGWIEAELLEAGDALIQSDKQQATVVSVTRETLPGPEPVYNFEVEDFHTYYVSASVLDSPILTHNKCDPPIGSTRHINNLNRASNGTYRVTFKSGKVYIGKGGTSRARRSARQRSRDHSDPVESIEHWPADNDADAFRKEHELLTQAGGPTSNGNYNQINSPGKNQ